MMKKSAGTKTSENVWELADKKKGPWIDSEIVLMNILAFLPIATLLRFKSVSKRWYEIISSSNFINLHLNRHKFMYDYFIPSLDEDKHIVLYNLLSVLYNTIYGDKPESSCCGVVGYAQGFGCFWFNYMVQVYCLFDFKKKGFVFLPNFTSRPQRGDVVQTGFDFIPAIDDYKLVVIKIGKDRDVEVNLYTKSSDSWKKIRAELPCFMTQFSVCKFDGKHVMGTGIDENRVEYVVYFDMVREEFGMIEWRVWSNKEGYCLRRVTVLNEGRLVIFACPNVWNKRFVGWILEEEDVGAGSADGDGDGDARRPLWKKVLSIGMPSPFEPLGFWSNGWIVIGFVKEDEGNGTSLQLWLHDPRSKANKRLNGDIGRHVRLPCLCDISLN